MKEILMTIGLVLILVFLASPWGKQCDDMLLVAICTVLIVLFILFSIFIWKEKPQDEREQAIMEFASRVGYTAGMTFLLIGIIFQSFSSKIDPWMVAALIVMILSKLIAFKYSLKHR
jgi:peptidoglycan/LPS O-acetylase OafA/YrhL